MWRRFHLTQRARRNKGSLPNILLAGSMKSGTTYLHNLLIQHPSISGSRYDIKEAWSALLRKKYPDTWLNYYKAFFKTDTLTLQIDSSPQIIAFGEPEHFTWARYIIVSLRNPIDRAYSQYHFLRKKYELGMRHMPLANLCYANSFEEMIHQERHYGRHNITKRTLLARGHYCDQLEKWWTIHPRHHFHIICAKQLFTQPETVLAQTFDFLNVHQMNIQTEIATQNQTQYPKMADDTRHILREYYAKHNQRLYYLLDHDFGWQ